MNNPTTIKSVRFEGLPKDVDLKSDLGHQKRKEQKLRRKRRKEEKKALRKANVEFLVYVARLLLAVYVAGLLLAEEHEEEERTIEDFSSGSSNSSPHDTTTTAEMMSWNASDGIFRPANKLDLASKMLALDDGRRCIEKAKDNGYVEAETEDKDVAKQLVDNVEQWKDDIIFLYTVALWRTSAENQQLYTSKSTSVGSQESVPKVILIEATPYTPSDVPLSVDHIFKYVFIDRESGSLYITLQGYYLGDFDKFVAVGLEQLRDDIKDQLVPYDELYGATEEIPADPLSNFMHLRKILNWIEKKNDFTIAQHREAFGSVFDLSAEA